MRTIIDLPDTDRERLDSLCHQRGLSRAEGLRRALRQQSEALCQQQSPRSSFSWLEPPRNAAEIKPEPYPLLEEADLLSDPNAVLEQEERLLNPAPTAPAQPGASSD